jgi:predicted aldo/keto reductase-like oxidoreductase
MLRRRFGKTGLQLPVLSCGGMRYQQSWNPEDAVGDDSQRNLEATVRRALELGIVHIETARGYGTSERQLGRLLPSLPREQIVVQTKIAPLADPERFEADFRDSLGRLGLKYVDLLALHGINDRQTLDWSLRPGGCLERAHRLVELGLARHVGFSTHGPTDVIVSAIEDGRFEYVNLHYYYFQQDNLPAVAAATERDMGVFIISPSDKGGRLYEPPPKLVLATAPMSPIVFNDCWCLLDERIHVLSIGASRPSDLDEHVAAVHRLMADSAGVKREVAQASERIRRDIAEVFGAEWVDGWSQGLPGWDQVPGGINLREILRLYTLARALDMTEYGRSRYNLLGSGGHWFPGQTAELMGNHELTPALSQSPFAARLEGYLREAHSLLGGTKKRRLQQP